MCWRWDLNVLSASVSWLGISGAEKPCASRVRISRSRRVSGSISTAAGGPARVLMDTPTNIDSNGARRLYPGVHLRFWPLTLDRGRTRRRAGFVTAQPGRLVTAFAVVAYW